MQLEEIAAKFGTTKQAVSQSEKDAIRKLWQLGLPSKKKMREDACLQVAIRAHGGEGLSRRTKYKEPVLTERDIARIKEKQAA